MALSFLRSRLDSLASAQNTDGGWGYFPGRGSWLEPTFYVMMALHGHANYASGWERAWRLIRGWQTPEGGVRPNSEVQLPNWTTALWVTIHYIRGVQDQNLERAVGWLLDTRGAEGALWRRVVEAAKPKTPGYDPNQFGWSWFPETNSWVEPTVHSLVALKMALRGKPGGNHPRRGDLEKRIHLGERMILDRRCQDGGWNYGAQLAIGVPLPSYPESTGVALVGLQGNRSPEVPGGLDVARQLLAETRSPLGKAWLETALRVHRANVPDRSREKAAPRDTLIAALEALACPDGNHALLRAAGEVAA